MNFANCTCSSLHGQNFVILKQLVNSVNNNILTSNDSLLNVRHFAKCFLYFFFHLTLLVSFYILLLLQLNKITYTQQHFSASTGTQEGQPPPPSIQP